MLVCLCKGVSDRQIREAIRSGARTLGQIRETCCGAGTDCGSCVRQIRTMLGDSAPQARQQFEGTSAT